MVLNHISIGTYLKLEKEIVQYYEIVNSRQGTRISASLTPVLVAVHKLETTLDSNNDVVQT